MKDGISKVKSEIKGVMGIMQGNIAKVLDRGAKLEDLQDKSGMVYSMVLTVCADIHVMLLYALMMFTLLIGVWLAVMFLFLDNLNLSSSYVNERCSQTYVELSQNQMHWIFLE